MSKAKNLATFGDNVDSSGNITDLNIDSNTLVVDSANNRVGIGTSSPNFLLDLEGASNSTYLRVGGDDVNNDRGLRFTSSASASFNGAVHTITAPSSQGEIAFATYNTEALRIDASGNVGIGISEPDAALHVKDATSGAGRGIHIGTGSVGAADDAHVLLNGRANYGYEGGRIVISDRNANGTSTSKNFKISLYDSDQFYINGSAGRVGIGTSSPLEKLDIANGLLRFGNNATPTDENDNAAYFGKTGGQAFISHNGGFAFRDNGTERLVIDTGGNVGIGTTSPGLKLHVVGDIRSGTETQEGVKLTANENGGQIELLNNSGAVRGLIDIWDADNDDGEGILRFLQLGTDGTEIGNANATGTVKIVTNSASRITALANGNVGIGTDAPGSILDVNGTTTLQGGVYLNRTSVLNDAEGTSYTASVSGTIGTTSHIVAGQGTGAVGLSLNDGYGNANLTFNHHHGTPDVTGNSLRIETNVDSTTGANMTFEGKSTTTAGTTVNLNFMAVMYADTGNMTIGGSLTQNSDLRIKKDLQIIPDALDKVKTLNGYTYTRTDRDSEFQQTGCVAQEVQAVLPEAVTVGEDEQQTLSIAYGSMVGLLVEAIKELEAKVAALESGS